VAIPSDTVTLTLLTGKNIISHTHTHTHIDTHNGNPFNLPASVQIPLIEILTLLQELKVKE